MPPMAPTPVAERMTAKEYLRRPRRIDKRRVNLIDGELVVNEPSPLHEAVLFDLAFALESWGRSGSARGTVWLPLDVRLDERNVFAPDVLFYTEGRGPQR